MGMPAALLANQAPAAAAAGKRVAQGQVSVTITGMNPQHAGPGTTITLTGTVTNSSRQPISNLSVQLLASSTPVSTSAELRPGRTGQDGLASTPVPRGTWKSGSELQPGSTDTWSVKVKAKLIGMKRFGVYPLTARAQSGPAAVPLAATSTYLPYVPAKKGPYGSSVPAPTKISWVMPLIDKPLLGQPWQRSCQVSQTQALAASLRSSGRLGQLLAAGRGPTGTAEDYSVAAGSQRTAQNHAVRSGQAQSLSGYDGVTWAVDPALLANVTALAGCGSSQPRWARAASSWLTELSQVTEAEPMFVTPYADPNVAALVNDGFPGDVQASFTLGRAIGQKILPRNPSLTASGQAAGIAWPADGVGTGRSAYSMVENLAARDDIRTLLVSSSALPNEQSTALQVTNGGPNGGYMTVLLADDSLTRLLATGGSTTGSAFATEQDFLAQTALAAQQGSAPVIVAPPRRWDPATGLATDLLAETASAPWLSPASLASLTAGKHIPTVPNPHWAVPSARISNFRLNKLHQLHLGIRVLNGMAAVPDKSLPLALATIESSAWQGTPRATAQAMLGPVLNQINKQEHAVQIVAEPRVTLGGLKGTVPVSIDNGLGYAVKVALRLRGQTANVKVTPAPSGIIWVPRHTAKTVRLHVQATEVGSTTITMSLLNKSYRPLQQAAVQSMTVEATQVGVIVVIICAAVVGVFLIAYAARVARRGHPAGGAGDPADPRPAADQRTEPAEPDTVMAERTELGAAGAPGP
jgi:Family of unknown function (DUF6049)